MARWTSKQRDAAIRFLSIVQPNNAAQMIRNIEDFMPKQWRDGFEAMFEILDAHPNNEPVATLLPGEGEHGGQKRRRR